MRDILKRDKRRRQKLVARKFLKSINKSAWRNAVYICTASHYEGSRNKLIRDESLKWVYAYFIIKGSLSVEDVDEESVFEILKIVKSSEEVRNSIIEDFQRIVDVYNLFI